MSDPDRFRPLYTLPRVSGLGALNRKAWPDPALPGTGRMTPYQGRNVPVKERHRWTVPPARVTPLPSLSEWEGPPYGRWTPGLSPNVTGGGCPRRAFWHGLAHFRDSMDWAGTVHPSPGGEGGLSRRPAGRGRTAHGGGRIGRVVRTSASGGATAFGGVRLRPGRGSIADRVPTCGGVGTTAFGAVR